MNLFAVLAGDSARPKGTGGRTYPGYRQVCRSHLVATSEPLLACRAGEGLIDNVRDRSQME